MADGNSTESEGEFEFGAEESPSGGKQNVTSESPGELSYENEEGENEEGENERVPDNSEMTPPEGDEFDEDDKSKTVPDNSIMTPPERDELDSEKDVATDALAQPEITSESDLYDETEDTDYDWERKPSPKMDSFKGRNFEKEGPGPDKKYILQNIIGPLLNNLHSQADKDYIMDNILSKMVDLAAGSPEYDLISGLLDDLLKDVCKDQDDSALEEEEEEEYTKEYLHYLIDMYCIPHRKDRFDLTYEFLEACLHRLTDKRKELLLRGNDMMLYMHRRIEDSDLQMICDFVKCRPDVITLDLAYNSITDFGMQVIADLLQETPTLKRLNLMNNDFGPVGMAEIGDLADCLHLDTLRVSGNELGVKGGYHVSKLLKGNSKLQYLDVAQTSQRTESLMDHIDAMYTNKHLIYLNVSRPLGEPVIGFDSGHWADAIGKMLEVNSTLRELYVQKCNFICHDMERLMLCMKRNRTLYLLDLTANNVGDHGAEVLSEYLETRPALMVLLLAHNNIADEGGRALSYGIPNSRLQMLDVSYNRMTDHGVMSLITTLKKPTMMRGIYIWGNTITHPTCQILKRIIRADVLEPDGIDVKVYNVDGVDHVAYYPADRYNAMYYCVPRIRFDLFHYPPKRRPPAPPDVGRICPRMPYAWRVEPLDLHCPDTGPHARLSVHPRHCWWPRKPLPPDADPGFMVAERAKRTYREPRFFLDESGNVVERELTGAAPPYTMDRAADGPSMHRQGSFARHEPLELQGELSPQPQPDNVSLLAKPITKDEILKGKPFRERRSIKDALEAKGPEPSREVKDKTLEVLEEKESEMKPVDTRGTLYESSQGNEDPMEEFDARQEEDKKYEGIGEEAEAEEGEEEGEEGEEGEKEEGGEEELGEEDVSEDEEDHEAPGEEGEFGEDEEEHDEEEEELGESPTQDEEKPPIDLGILNEQDPKDQPGSNDEAPEDNEDKGDEKENEYLGEEENEEGEEDVDEKEQGEGDEEE